MARKIPRNVKVAAMKAYVAEEKTLKQVGKEFNINPESLRRWLGDKVRPRGSHFKGVSRKITPVVISTKKHTKIKSSDIPNNNKRWTAEEDEMLRDAVLSKMTVKETIDLMGRSKASIYCRKSQLIDDGFINDEVRFPVPSGIKRVRKVMDTPMDVEATIEAIVEETPVVKEVSSETPKVNNIELSDLARLVKEFGVNVTVSVTDKGMEVKMCN